MRFLFTLFLVVTLFYSIDASSTKSFNSFSIKGKSSDCNLTISTNTKCISACGKFISIQREFMSQTSDKYILNSYETESNCQQNVLVTSTKFACDENIAANVGDLSISCFVSQEQDSKDTQINNQINTNNKNQTSNDPKTTQKPNSQPATQQQNNNNEGNSSTTLIYSFSLIILSLSSMLLV